MTWPIVGCTQIMRPKISIVWLSNLSQSAGCWDNAVAESVFRSLKTEWSYHTELNAVAHARHELFDYIERFYNHQRLHATLDYVSPAVFEKQNAA